MSETWSIERLVPGGEGFARLADGRVGFAPGTAPGDRIRVLLSEDHRSYVRATAHEVLEPGPARIAPPCPVAADCGGCDLMHLALPAQLEAKRGLLLEALRRTGGLQEAPVADPVVSVGPALGYRHRVRLHADAEGRLGFHARGSHAVVPVHRCLVCRDAVNAALAALAAAPPEVLAELGSVEVREALGGGPTLLAFTPTAPLSADAQTFLGTLREQYSIAAPGLAPPPPQRFVLPGELELELPAGAFTQVNWAVNTALVEHLTAGAVQRGLRDFCELYSGIGNFTLPLLRAGLHGLAIERDRGAIGAARSAARRLGLPADGFVSDDGVRSARRLAREGRRFDLVVLDPPRTGAREAISAATALARRAIALCSCDPVTLARDVKLFLLAGCTLETLTAFDMFPQTHHLETIAWLRAPERPARERPARERRGATP